MTKETIIAELSRELSMRLKVWKTIPQTPNFVSPDHQRRYDAMQAALLVFQTMYAGEFHQIVNRIERLRRESEAQTSLPL